MSAFRKLPFQFQQRGAELAAATTADADKYAKYTEARDQDLENYLAGLGGNARVSVGSFQTIATKVVAAGSGFQNTSAAFISGTGGFATFDTNGFVPSDSAVTAVDALFQSTVEWHNTASTTPGFAQVGTLLGNLTEDLVLTSASGSLGFIQTGFGYIPGLPTNFALPAITFQVRVFDVSTDLQTSTGTLGGVTELDAFNRLVYLVVVD